MAADEAGVQPSADVPARRRAPAEEDRLSTMEWTLFGFLFLIIPCFSVAISTALYFAWRKDKPKRAKQIVLLGLTFFVLSPVLYVLAFALGTWLAQNSGIH
jgi:hypothetical protein